MNTDLLFVLPGPVRRLAAVFALCALAPAVASANLITDGDFESGAPIATSFNLLADNAATHNAWIDVLQWQRVEDPTSPGNFVAQHIADLNSTNLLFQGFDASGLAAGTSLQIDFDYLFTAGGGLRRFHMIGLQAGGELSRFAPFNVTNGGFLNTWNLGTAADWTSVSELFTLADSYAVLAFAVEFSSGPNADTWAGIRAVDNVSITAVPAPAPLALLGAGLIALSLIRRRRTWAVRP